MIVMGDCIDCGAPETPVHETALPGGYTARVRRCEPCLARVDAWRADVVVRRRAARSRELLAGATSAERSTGTTTADGASRAALLVALDGLGT